MNFKRSKKGANLPTRINKSQQKLLKGLDTEIPGKKITSLHSKLQSYWVDQKVIHQKFLGKKITPLHSKLLGRPERYPPEIPGKKITEWLEEK